MGPLFWALLEVQVNLTSFLTSAAALLVEDAVVACGKPRSPKSSPTLPIVETHVAPNTAD